MSEASVASQRVTDLEADIRQIRQLSCILDSCTISASYKVGQAQKVLLLLPHTGASRYHPRMDDEYNVPTHEDQLCLLANRFCVLAPAPFFVSG